MSETKTDHSGGGRQGQGQGQRRRRRSRGGRNRNRNRNNQQGNSNQNKDGGQRQGRQPGHGRVDDRKGGQGRGQGGQGGQRSRGRSRSSREPKPVKLTWWQKFLKALGLYKEPARGKGRPKTKDKPAKDTPRVVRKPDSAKSAKSAKSAEAGEATRERRPPENIEVDSGRLYLGNLSYEASETDLEELFKGVGTVRRVGIAYNRSTHRSKGYGFVEMMNTDEARRAIEVLHDQFFMGRRLIVSGAKNKEDEEDETPRAEEDQAPEAAAEETPKAEESNPS